MSTRKRARTPEEQAKIQELQAALMNHITQLVIKKATLDDSKCNNCPLAREAREIAKILDELWNLRPGPTPTPATESTSGSEEGGVSGG